MNRRTNSRFSFSLVNSGSVALAARIRAPPVEAGLSPAKAAVRHIMLIRPLGETPTVAAMSPTVGTMVGQTTPMAELNQDRMPALRPWMATEVRGVMMVARALDIRSTPPTDMTTSINIPTPVTISRVDQEMDRNTAFSSAARITTRTMPAAKEIRPTLRPKKVQAMITTRKAIRVKIWFRLKAGSVSWASRRLPRTLYPLKKKKVKMPRMMVVMTA